MTANMLDNRKKIIFKTLVREHVRTGLPVGSNFLLGKIGMDISSATVRNEFAELAELGLLSQPHASAGRVPSEAGFKFYIDNLMEECVLDEKAKAALKNIKKQHKENNKELYKALAKEIAEISGETAIVAFNADDIFYTGFSNLFSKPEMAGVEINLGAIVDEMNEIMKNVYSEAQDGEIKTLIGRECPFSDNCSAVFTKMEDSLFVIFGLLRTDYEKNKSIIKFLIELNK